MTTPIDVRQQDYVPEKEWPAVSVMLDGFGSPSLPDSPALAGTSMDVRYDDDSSVRYRFESVNELSVHTLGSDGGQSSVLAYRAVEVRPSIFYIDYLRGTGAHTHDVSIVVDLSDGRVTTADSCFVDRGGRIRTHTDFRSGRVQGTGPIEPRRRTDALVGKRIFYRYSDSEAYEHIYLNSGTFVWQCVRGGEKGLADVDQTMTFELAENIHIFFWTETVMPVDSFLVIDLAHERSIGRMFCWDAPTLEPVHLPFDSRFTVLNETEYPAD